MAYLIGIALALAVAGFAGLTGLDRERGFYPTVLVVIASYYDLFAVMGGAMPVLGVETLGLVAYAAVAVIGFRTSLWVVVAGMAAHAALDTVHAALIANFGAPAWWPPFCLSFDLTLAVWLGWRLATSSPSAARR